MARYALLLLAFLLIAGCGEDRKRPGILLVTLDTVRIDRLGCYGGEGGLTPHIDRIAAESVLFRKAYCQAPITRPSHASMLTSRYPRSHGVMTNRDALAGGIARLPEILHREGYRTAAFTGVRLLSESGGFADGFDHFSLPREGTRTRRAADTVREVDTWLSASPETTSPLFLWVHFFDAHFPYQYDESVEGMPALGDYDGPIRTGSMDEIAEAAGESVLNDRGRARLAALYDAKIGYLDHWIGRLRTLLEERGLWNEMEIFLLTDHGEGFEKGVYLEHVNSLYEPVSSIAFLWRRPGGVLGGRAVGETVQEIDLMPTALGAARIASPAELEGHSLFPLLDGSAADEGNYAFTEEPPLVKSQLLHLTERNRFFFAGDGQREKPVLRPSGERISLTDGRWKYIYDSERDDEYYDLERDPFEQVNRADSSDADELPRLRHMLKGWRETHPLPSGAGADSLDAETRQLLESLGYL